jgi:hypothetical protein
MWMAVSRFFYLARSKILLSIVLSMYFLCFVSLCNTLPQVFAGMLTCLVVMDVQGLIVIRSYALQNCLAFVYNSMMLVIFSLTFIYVRALLMEYRTKSKHKGSSQIS